MHGVRVLRRLDEFCGSSHTRSASARSSNPRFFERTSTKDVWREKAACPHAVRPSRGRRPADGPYMKLQPEDPDEKPLAHV